MLPAIYSYTAVLIDLLLIMGYGYVDRLDHMLHRTAVLYDAVSLTHTKAPRVCSVVRA